MKGNSSSNQFRGKQFRGKQFRAFLRSIARQMNHNIILEKSKHLMRDNIPNQRQRRKLARQMA